MGVTDTPPLVTTVACCGLGSVAVAPAAPLPQPMLLRSGTLPTRGDWSFEVKWDGFRALVSTEGGVQEPPGQRRAQREAWRAVKQSSPVGCF
jgi:hypothetical protein